MSEIYWTQPSAVEVVCWDGSDKAKKEIDGWCGQKLIVWAGTIYLGVGAGFRVVPPGFFVIKGWRAGEVSVLREEEFRESYSKMEY